MKKQNILIVIVTVVIALLIAFLGGYWLSNVLNKEHLDNNGNSHQGTNDNQNIKISQKELEKYLTYVPIFGEHMSNDDYNKYYGYSNDAYSGKNITINELDKKLLLATVYNLTTKLSETEKKNILNCAGDTDCEVVLAEDLKSNAKNIYNISNIQEQKFTNTSAEVSLNGKYYVARYGRGFTILKKINKLLSYEVNNNDLIIYEKAAFVYGDDSSNAFVAKLTNSGQIDTEKISMNNWQEVENYIKNNLDDFYTFKHTFKLGENNQYYYYSTERSN